MGLYTDASTLLTAQPEISDAPEQTIEQAITDTEAEINGHVAKLYTLPITVPVPLLTSIANDIAIFKIFTSRKFTNPPKQVEEAWTARYKAAVAMLLAIAAGEMLLVGVDGLVVTQDAPDINGRAWSNTMRYVPTFGEGPDQGFFVDRNKVMDEMERRP